MPSKHRHGAVGWDREEEWGPWGGGQRLEDRERKRTADMFSF